MSLEYNLVWKVVSKKGLKWFLVYKVLVKNLKIRNLGSCYFVYKVLKFFEYVFLKLLNFDIEFKNIKFIKKDIDNLSVMMF